MGTMKDNRNQSDPWAQAWAGVEARIKIEAATKKLPAWAAKIVDDAKEEFLAELYAMQTRIKTYQAEQMAAFVEYSKKLTSDMVEAVKEGRKRSGLDFLAAMGKAQEMKEKTIPKEQKN